MATARGLVATAAMDAASAMDSAIRTTAMAVRLRLGFGLGYGLAFGLGYGLGGYGYGGYGGYGYGGYGYGGYGYGYGVLRHGYGYGIPTATAWLLPYGLWRLRWLWRLRLSAYYGYASYNTTLLRLGVRLSGRLGLFDRGCRLHVRRPATARRPAPVSTAAWRRPIRNAVNPSGARRQM